MHGHGANPNARTHVMKRCLTFFKLFHMLLITRDVMSVNVVGVDLASGDCNADVVGSICLNEVAPIHML